MTSKDQSLIVHHAPDWLLGMRWFAIAGQVVAIAVAVLAYNAPLDLIGLGAVVVIAVTTNILGYIYRPLLTHHRYATVAGLLGLDTLLLTALLLFSGGLHNPFTSFFLLHITLATVLMRKREAVVLTALAFCCVFLIYRFPYADPHAHHWISMGMHFSGMMLTLFLTGGCILFFVGQLQRELQTQQRLLQESEQKIARQQRVVGLATLAAGIAHELATPLSTIAVASHELRLTAGQFCKNNSCLSDSLLIRKEVDRCRAIIDRLSARGEVVGPRLIVLSAEYLCGALSGYLPTVCMERLQTDCSEEITIHTDEVALLQSVAALIKNGCEADPTGAPVALKVKSCSGAIQIEVKDKGPGMPEHVLRRLGEPFVTTKDPGKGIGLGLYLVHMFCYLNQGSVRFLPDVTGGTRVVLELTEKVTT